MVLLDSVRTCSEVLLKSAIPMVSNLKRCGFKRSQVENQARQIMRA